MVTIFFSPLQVGVKTVRSTMQGPTVATGRHRLALYREARTASTSLIAGNMALLLATGGDLFVRSAHSNKIYSPHGQIPYLVFLSPYRFGEVERLRAVYK